MNEKTICTRNSSLDFLRILACFLVILLHTAAARWYNADVNGTAWKTFNFYNSAARSCVPLFFMLSGNLFLNKSEMPSISALFSKYILKLVVLYVVWGLFYAVDKLGFQILLSGDIPAIVTSFVTSPKVHLWYLPALVGVYLLLPVMWCVAKHKDGQYLGYACAVFFVVGIAWNTVQAFIPSGNELTTFLNRFSYALSGHSGYFLLGYYLSKKDFSKVKSHHLILACIAVILTAVKIGELDAIAAGKPKGLLYSNLYLPACLEAMLICIIFLKQKIQLSASASKAVASASRCTLFIYLFHPFVLDHFPMWFGLHTESFSPILATPLLAMLVFIICFALAQILTRIPFVNKWLV